MRQQNWLKVPDDAEWKLTYISYSQPTMQINIEMYGNSLVFIEDREG
jgi:hypothetical protein